MGNLISTIFSGFGNILGKIFGSPVDFLSGKSCNSVCGSTWDVMCYIENFCVAHLAKMAMVLVLSYMVLLFFYLLYKLRICKCICCSICKIIWALLVSWFSLWEYCCTCLCVGLMKLKRTRQNAEGESEKSWMQVTMNTMMKALETIGLEEIGLYLGEA